MRAFCLYAVISIFQNSLKLIIFLGRQLESKLIELRNNGVFNKLY